MSIESFFRILKARWLLTAMLLCFCLIITLVISMMLPKSYTATAELIVDGMAEDLMSGQVTPARAGYMATQVDIIQSRNVADRVYGLLSQQEKALVADQARREAGDEASPEAWLAGFLSRNVRASPGRDSSVVSVSVQSSSPELAAVLANAHTEAYVNTNLQLRTDPALRFSEWYESQMDVLRENLRSAHQELTAYQQEHGIVALDERLDVETDRLRELSSMVVDAQGQSMQDEIRESQINGSVTNADILANPVILELRSELAKAETLLADLSTRYGVNHPEHRKASAEVAAIEERLAQEVSVIGQSMRSDARFSTSNTRQLEAALAAQKQRVLDLNAQRDGLELLRQEVAMAQEAYNAAAGRASANRLESRLAETDVTVLNAAVAPVLPSSPNIRLNLVVAAALGLLLGIGISLLLELTNRRVRSPADIEEYLGLPVLAYLPASGRSMRRREITAQ